MEKWLTVKTLGGGAVVKVLAIVPGGTKEAGHARECTGETQSS